MHEERYVVRLLLLLKHENSSASIACMYLFLNTALTFVRTIEVFNNISIFVCSHFIIVVVDLNIIIEISVAVQLLVVSICQESLHGEKIPEKKIFCESKANVLINPKPEFQLFGHVYFGRCPSVAYQSTSMQYSKRQTNAHA